MKNINKEPIVQPIGYDRLSIAYILSRNPGMIFEYIKTLGDKAKYFKVGKTMYYYQETFDLIKEISDKKERYNCRENADNINLNDLEEWPGDFFTKYKIEKIDENTFKVISKDNSDSLELEQILELRDLKRKLKNYFN